MALPDVNELTFEEVSSLGLDLMDEEDEGMEFSVWHSILLDTLLANLPKRHPPAE